MKVLIVGGGIGGLTLANALQQKGIEYALFEQAEELRTDGAGITLWANAMRMLEKIGVAEQVRRCSSADFHGTIGRLDGSALLIQTPNDMRRNYGEFVALHRIDVMNALKENLEPSCIHTKRQFIRYTMAEEKVVAVFGADRENKVEEVEGDCLVGCDGLHSVVRTQMVGFQKPIYSGYTCWRSVVAADHKQIFPGELWGYGQRFGQVPLGKGLVYWFATKNAPEKQRASQGEKHELQKLYAGWHPSVRTLIDATQEEAILRNDIYDRNSLERWSEGRVTLLGDAAHPMTPNLGQGGCQAIEDAIVLAEYLSKESMIQNALEYYERLRLPRTRIIAKQSRIAGDIAQWEQPFAVWVRNAVFKLGLNSIFAKRVGSLVNAKDILPL